MEDYIENRLTTLAFSFELFQEYLETNNKPCPTKKDLRKLINIPNVKETYINQGFLLKETIVKTDKTILASCYKSIQSLNKEFNDLIDLDNFALYLRGKYMFKSHGIFSNVEPNDIVEQKQIVTKEYMETKGCPESKTFEEFIYPEYLEFVNECTKEVLNESYNR